MYYFTDSLNRLFYTYSIPVSLTYSRGYSLFGVILLCARIYIHWMVLVKAGEKGWKSLIPFYSNYVEYQLYWDSKYFWISLFLPLVIMISTIVCYNYSIIWLLFVVFVLFILFLICPIILEFKKAKSFNQSAAFGVGLLLLNLVFNAIICFDSSCVYTKATDANQSSEEI